MSAKSKKDNQSAIVVNKKAGRNFELVERFEAGLSLLGTEVKSLRAGTADLSGSYARIINDECFLIGASITQYDRASTDNHEPTRKRKLLLHAAEIRKIKIQLQQRGFTLVPLKMYFNKRGFAKLQLALARGKKQYDKRSSIIERSQEKQIRQRMRKFRT